MSTFKNMCHRTQAFRRLRSITLTVDICMSVVDWTQNIDRLLGTAPLEAFQLYPTSIFGDIPIPDDFWRSIVTTHGTRLKCFSVHRMQLSLTVLRSMCSQCPRLEQLFVVLCQGDLVSATTDLADVQVSHLGPDCRSSITCISGEPSYFTYHRVMGSADVTSYHDEDRPFHYIALFLDSYANWVEYPSMAGKSETCLFSALLIN